MAKMKKKTRSIISDKTCQISELEKRVSELERKFQHLVETALASCCKPDILNKCSVCHVNLNSTQGYVCGIDNCPSKLTITTSAAIKSTVFSWTPYPKS